MSTVDVKRVFLDALDRAPDERAAYVRKVCADDADLRREVDALLTSLHEHPEFLSEPAPAAAAAEHPGAQIDRYRLLSLIGEGGFGSVWMAEQLQPVRRRVALKIVKLGMDTKQVVARFEAERQALALMEHPNIATVLDGGATETGRPYFVMELVRGVPITDYCDQANLPNRDRLALFRKVCDAVHHAHQKGVIHRDLKASNVLVTLCAGDPVPKVIDFGIAKATSAELTKRTLFTEFRQIIGTPESMAPEQAELSGLDVDTRADVYSMGVLLYELLTGTPPFDRAHLLEHGYAAMLQQIKEIDPPKPSTRVSTLAAARLCSVAQHRLIEPASLSRTIRGDLDAIVMRAMEKDRERRYVSASDFGADVGRFLQGLPLEAGPPSALYRARRYARRHRRSVAGATMVFVSLLAGLAAAALALSEARSESRRAQREAERLGAVQRFLREELLGSVLPDRARGEDVTIRAVLDRAANELDHGKLAAVPHVEVDLRHAIGSLYRSLGQLDKAEHQLRTALAVNRTGGAEDASQSESKVLARLGAVLLYQGRDTAGERTLREALAKARRSHGAESRLVAAIAGDLAGALLKRGELEQARTLRQRALDLTGQLDGPRSKAYAIQVSGLATILLKTRDLEGARRRFREGLELFGEVLGEPNTYSAEVHNSIAFCLAQSGDFDAACREAKASLRMRRKLLRPPHRDLARTMSNLGGYYLSKQEVVTARRWLRKAAEMFRQLPDAMDLKSAMCLRQLGLAHMHAGDWDAAELCLRESQTHLDAAPEVPASDRVELGDHLGQTLLRRRKFEAAARELERVRTTRLAMAAGNPWRLARTTFLLGKAYAGQDELKLAQAEMAHALDLCAPLPGAMLQRVKMRGVFVRVLFRLDELEEAERQARLQIAELRELTTDHPLDWRVAEGRLGQVLVARNRLDEAEPMLRRACGDTPLPADLAAVHRRNVRALIEVYERQDRGAEAQPWRDHLQALDVKTAAGK
ncbi:MAG: tetratricopeptide repeat protein [Planctomycetota bacterium]